MSDFCISKLEPTEIDTILSTASPLDPLSYIYSKPIMEWMRSTDSSNWSLYYKGELLAIFCVKENSKALEISEFCFFQHSFSCTDDVLQDGLSLFFLLFPSIINLNFSFPISLSFSNILQNILLKHNSILTFQNEYYVDLRKSLDQIKKDVRKSYRNLINKSYSLFNVTIYDYSNLPDEIWSAYRALHKVAANKETRSPENWLSQKKIIETGNGCLVVTADRDGIMQGASFFAYNKKECIYGSSANNRSLFDLPIGHAAQWEFIKFAKSNGHEIYRIGFSGGANCTPKEKNIALFKKGFTKSSKTWIFGEMTRENFSKVFT